MPSALNNSHPASLSVPLLCRGNADKLDLSLRSIAVAAKDSDLWLEILLVPWQVTPCGLERITAALATHTRLAWLEHNASSEPAALQQAWRQARGAWIWWLEAGDQLEPGALVDWLSIVKHRPDLVLVAGEGVHLNRNGLVLRRHRALPTSTRVRHLTIQGLYCPGAIVWRHSLLTLSAPPPERHNFAYLQLSLIEILAEHNPRCMAVSNLWVRTRSTSDWHAPGRCRDQALALTEVLKNKLGHSPGNMLHNYGLQLQLGEAQPTPGRYWLEELESSLTSAETQLSADTLVRLRQSWGLDPQVQPWQEMLETQLAAGGLKNLWCVTLMRNSLHTELGSLHLGSPWGPNLRLACRLISPELWGQYRLLRQDAEILKLLNQHVREMPLIGLLQWLEKPELQQQFPLSHGLERYASWWSEHAQAELNHIRFGESGLIEAEPWRPESGMEHISPVDMLHNYGLQLQRGEASPAPGRTWLQELTAAITTAEPMLNSHSLMRLRQAWGLDPQVEYWQITLETKLVEDGLEQLWCVTLLRNLLHPDLGALQLGSPWGPNRRLAERLLSPGLWGQYRLLRQDADLINLLNQLVSSVPLVGMLHWLQWPQLQQKFPLPTSLKRYSAWWSDHAQSELSHIRFGSGGLIEAEPWGDDSQVPAVERPFGVNLIGHAFEVFGIGEDVRMAALALSSAEVPFCVVNVPANNGASRSDRSLEPQTLPPGELGHYRFNLVCLAAPSHGAWIAREGLAQQQGRTTIVAWPWETQTWPRAWECLIPLADVFWPSSTFTAQALKPFSDPCRRPMQVMPMTVHIDNPQQYRQTARRRATRERWNLDLDAKLVLFVFDVKSSLARKNPWGAIDAFQHAFTAKEFTQVQLVIKALRPMEPNAEWETLQRKAGEDPRLILIDKDLKRVELIELMGCCDVFLSMHRSEGFGRGIAEAGILGLEVVTSSFGGNADFCLGSSFHLVTCNPSTVAANAYPQAEGHIWGEPNLEEAVQHLRHTMRSDRPGHAVQRSNNILDLLSREACGQRYAEELKRLQNILYSQP